MRKLLALMLALGAFVSFGAGFARLASGGGHCHRAAHHADAAE